MSEYISREAVINITAETGAWETQNRIRELPSADVQPVDRWISVDDRLPKEWYEVLVYSEMGKIEQAIYVNGRWKLSAFLGEIVDVTHWQPLPEPPKDGDAE